MPRQSDFMSGWAICLPPKRVRDTEWKIALSVGSCTQIGTFKSGDQQKIRIELDNGVGRVFLNDVLAADNIDAYAQYYSNAVLIANVQNFNENNNYHYGFFLWAKVKSGRL